MVAGGDHPTGIAPCEHCGQPSHKRCSRCKAFSVCRQTCMAAVWPRHKEDCNSLVLMRLNARGLAVYDKYGVNEPPERGSDMNVDKKLAFFLEMLKVHDASSPENRGLPLPEKLFLTCRYNNTYRHAAETFTASEIAQLNALMHEHHVDMVNQPPQANQAPAKSV
ncbi:hypothetical protein PHYSODRAFT_470591 [Phytophthora sojae]|uniref:MYND-type domain-containing protein n=1 Tax=Phytophthora sojae (strain P6497) TaxID=1094619 RepID=G4YNM1_PHYSP|nr:hypothetical protein PHYSODRAFT_470591 [Phytophthora sojae]EGZ30420.1 hypothetical protein PHYSODRAFT_470591 [Phytophthora sojae]|eukprot:XP_009517695.1 hypothetical protein PHYSODRAFT_470591 [Phytophthora sojae]